MKRDSDSASQRPQRGDPQIPFAEANRLVSKFARIYAEASPDDQFALRAWMRDIILGRKVRTCGQALLPKLDRSFRLNTPPIRRQRPWMEAFTIPWLVKSDDQGKTATRRHADTPRR